MNAETYFLHTFVRNQSLFEEARETFETEGELYGLAALDEICDKLDLQYDLEELAEQYVRGDYNPLD